VTLEKVVAHAAAGAKSPQAGTLARGAAVRVREAKGDWVRVSVPSGDVWVPAGSFERLADREAREKREAAVQSFATQIGRAVEPCPILLAPDYGAARWGTLEDGDDVDVVLADHDFFGVRLKGKMLAFVPARSIRLLPSAVAETPGGPVPKGVAPAVESLGVPDRDLRPTPRAPAGDVSQIPPAGFAPAAPGVAASPAAPLVSLPDGAELPVLVTRVDPRYPEAARRTSQSGEVVLRAVVEANGTIGKIDVLSPGTMGMADAAVEAVKRWIYRPARVNGQPVAVWKVIRVKFALRPEREPPPD